MKKLLLLGFIFLLAVEMGFTISDITIEQPDGRTDWERHATKQIKWSIPSGVTGMITIVLFKNGARIGPIVTNLSPRLNTYSWEVGRWMDGFEPADTEYQIKIKEQGGPRSCFSPKFKIVDTGIRDVVDTGRRDVVDPSIKPELEIKSVWRVGTGRLHPGDLLTAKVAIQNHGETAADIFVSFLTLGPPFYSKANNRAIISGGTTKEYSLSIPVIERKVRNGYLQVNFFIRDALVTEDNVLLIQYRDSNMSNNQKEMFFGTVTPSGDAYKMPIRKTKTEYVSGWFTKMPQAAWCTQTVLPSQLSPPSNGQIRLGMERLWHPGADPFPCHNGTVHTYYGAVEFDLRQYHRRSDQIKQVNLKFQRAAISSSRNFFDPRARETKVAVRAISSEWQSGFNNIQNPPGILTHPALGELGENGTLEVTETVKAWLELGELKTGFFFEQLNKWSLGNDRFRNIYSTFNYTFELEIIVN
ncbi:MAG: hypothetical protein E4H23_00730 [Chrysiogenales bacterium]|nr:MAG: hypothetical protein E4H23_00730 [Chrysiogenales bacterium]